jgi:hypothetical protein
MAAEVGWSWVCKPNPSLGEGLSEGRDVKERVGCAKVGGGRAGSRGLGGSYMVLARKARHSK